MTTRSLLLALAALLAGHVCPQLLVRLFAKAYPADDPRGREMIGEVYRIKPHRRLGWALEQAERSWFEGLATRKLMREERKEREAERAARERIAQREERRRQEEAEFDAFLRGAVPGQVRAQHVGPRRPDRRRALLPGLLLMASSAGFGGLAMLGPDAKVHPVLSASGHVPLAVSVAVLLLLTAAVSNATAAVVRTPFKRQRRALPSVAIVRFPQVAITVVIEHNGRKAEGRAVAWGGGPVLVALGAGRRWAPAACVRRIPAT